MRVLVTGANGFIGGHLVERCAQAGWEVAAVQRQGTITRLVQVFPDLDLSPADLQDFDVIFHLAGAAHDRAQHSQKALNAINADAAVKLLAAAVQAGVPKFVQLSSIKVLGDVSERPFQTTDPYQPQDRYARSKMLAEQQLLDMDAGATQVSIVRPPLVYGPGVGANFAQLLRWSLSGWWLPLARATAPRAWLGVRNLANFLTFLGSPTLARASGIWHVRDEEEVSVVQMVDKIVHSAKRTPRVWALSPALARTVATLIGKRGVAQRLFEPLQIDVSSTQSELEWYPTYRQHEELDRLVSWYMDQ